MAGTQSDRNDSSDMRAKSIDADGIDKATLSSGDVARGVCRLFARNDIWCLTEMPLRNGRRADLMGLDGKGQIVIVEIKVARGDLLRDAKWPDYLDFCDRFFWALSPNLDRTLLEGPDFRPDCCGVIIADEYDAEIVRPAPQQPLAASRRKKEIERLARTALRRHADLVDPGLPDVFRA